MFKIEDLQAQVRKPGIYFNLSNEEYHADKSLSNSGMEALLYKSPKHYWFSSPLNPNRKPFDSDAFRKGRVLHTLLLEPEKFAAEWTIKKGVKTSSVPFTVGEGEYNEIQMAVIELRADPVINALFTYGFPEVSIFWVDEKTGVPCRVRTDWLGTVLVGDLKSTSDLGDYKLRYSIVDYGYYRQQALYLDGVEIIKQLIREGKAVVEGIDQDGHWFKSFMEAVHDKFAFVFQELKEPYVTRAETLCALTRDLGKGGYMMALQRYKDNYEKYGEQKWPSGYEGRVGLIQLDDLPPKINYK